MESSSSKERFRRLPYSAAQHPVQCMLQAEVGSRRIAHGTLQFSFSAVSSCLALPIRLALTIKFLKNVFRTPSSKFQTFMISSYQLLFSSMAFLNAFLCPSYQPSGATLSTSSISLGTFSSGFFPRYSHAFVSDADMAAIFAFSTSVLILSFSFCS